MKNMLVAFVFAIVGICGACSSSPSTAAAVNQVSRDMCNRAEECAPQAFNQQFKSQQECVDKIRSGAGGGNKTVSPCSQSELDTCSKDISRAACKADGSGQIMGVFDLPATCNKC